MSLIISMELSNINEEKKRVAVPYKERKESRIKELSQHFRKKFNKATIF